MRIPDPESDDDSDGSDMMNELYHFEKLDINDAKFEWFDLNKAMNGDGWIEMIKTEEKSESEPEIETVKDLEPKINPASKTEAKPETGLEPKTKKD